ncbi:MAG: hypothetical protein IPN34_23870 [Planctomycetes bacterium]|nr:hypothetical protein [Planctomycetota bacterium]
MNLKPLRPELTLDEAVALACRTYGVAADRLDRASLCSPLSRRIAAREHAAQDEPLVPEEPEAPSEFSAYDRFVEDDPHAHLWDLYFGRIEYVAADEGAWTYERTVRILGADRHHALPPTRSHHAIPGTSIECVSPLPYGRALDLASAAAGVPRELVHSVWYESAKMASRREPYEGATGEPLRVPHWVIEFDHWEAELRGGLWVNPCADLFVFEDERVELRRHDWMRRLPPEAW